MDGHYRKEHVFALQQAFAGYGFYQEQISECDKQLAACMDKLDQDTPSDEGNQRPKPRRRHEPDFNLHGELCRLTGVDLTQIDGIGAHTALKVISEIGTDMAR